MINSETYDARHVMRHEASAADWFGAYPVGSGRLGGMVFGALPVECVSVNQDSCYWGAPGNRIPAQAGEAFPKARALIMEGRVQEADDLIVSSMTGSPRYSRPYVPACEMSIRQWYDDAVSGAVEDYSRELDLRSGLVRIRCENASIGQERMCFAPLGHNVIIYRLTNDAPDGLSYSVNLWRRPYDPGSFEARGDRAALSVTLGEGGVKLAAMIGADASGANAKVYVRGDCLIIEHAREATILLAATTSLYDADPLAACSETLDRAFAAGYERMLADHAAAYSAQYDSMTLDLGSAASSYESMEKRLAAYREGADDPALEALFFHYGRYLLIASSQPGSQPANLQGIWNGQMTPPWDSNYTLNINLQMNYWPAEPTGLGALTQPLFDLIRRMMPHGRNAARAYYGCGGFVFHHNTDLYGDCAISSVQSAFAWVMGGAWMLMHLWEHYEYTLDLNFLKNELLPTLREAVAFYRDFLVEDAHGRLITGFSQSPENSCVNSRTGQRSMTNAAPAMDAQLLRDLFTITRNALRLADKSDPELEQYLNNSLAKLPQHKIGSRGQLLEWDEEYTEVTPHQGHKSHLYAAYPSSQINMDDTPELADAARRSLQLRAAPNRQPGGWPAAWSAALHARLRDPALAYYNVRGTLEHTHPNLFTGHEQVFQIDANLGATAAIAEMLLQSHGGALRPLPALPEGWADGSARGLRARGGFVVDLEWREGNLTKMIVYSSRNAKVMIMSPDGCIEADVSSGAPFIWER